MLGTNLITASVVLYKTSHKDLFQVLECAIQSPIDKVIVIDNSPTCELKQSVDSLKSSKLFYVSGQGNVGYGSAHNIGINKAIECSADYHIILNPDISFTSEVIVALHAFMDTHRDVGLVMPRVLYPNGKLQYLCKLLPTPLDIFGRRVLPSNLIKKRNERYEMHKMGYDKIWNCPILSGCFMFLRVSTIKKVGRFDERFFMYFEDFDLMRRLHKESLTVYYPNTEIIHNHAAEHHTNKVLLKASIKSAVQYFNKWGWICDKERRNINKAAFDEKNHILD